MPFGFLLAALSRLRGPAVLAARTALGAWLEPALFALAGLGVAVALSLGAHHAYARGAAAQDLVWRGKVAEANEHWHEVLRRASLASAQAAAREREQHVEQLQARARRLGELEQAIATQAADELARAAKAATKGGAKSAAPKQARPVCYPRAIVKVLNK